MKISFMKVREVVEKLHEGSDGQEASSFVIPQCGILSMEVLILVP